ncbi:MAG: hypothetical protein ACREND_08125 [Gemmatimonadaceae bacterium]
MSGVSTAAQCRAGIIVCQAAIAGKFYLPPTLEHRAAEVQVALERLRRFQLKERADKRRRANPKSRVSASDALDVLALLTNASGAIDAWLDAAGPLRQQLDDAISAQQNLLAANAAVEAIL